MKKIKLQKLNDMVINDTYDAKNFIGFTVTKHRDVNNVEYELEEGKEKYYFFGQISDNNVFISETRLLNTLLGEYIDMVESKEIYDHGYPEARLIPSNFYEDCKDSFLEHVTEQFAEKIENIVSEYF